MQKSPRRRVAVVSTVAVVAGMLGAVSIALEPANAQTTKALSFKSGPLTPTLKSLSATSSLRAGSVDLADVLGVPDSGAGSLIETPGGVLVDIRVTDVSKATQDRLTGAGATITFVEPKILTITAQVPATSLSAVAALSGVLSVAEVPEPEVNSICPAGPFVSEGDTMLTAALGRTNHGVDGSGVMVGVLSDSYDVKTTAATRAPADVTSGDLPGATNTCPGQSAPVQLQSEINVASDGGDEGRAMAHIVHDLAPGATIRVASAFNGEADFAQQIRNLATAGAKVIVDDITYFDEPMYQDGIVGQAVEDVVAAGVTYFSSAANSNFIDGAGNNVNSYEAQAYRPTTCPASVVTFGSYSSCHDFDPGAGVDNTYSATTATQGSFILGWNEPRFGLVTDFDMFLLNRTTGAIVKSSAASNLNTQLAYEFLQNTSLASFDLVIARDQINGSGSATPRFKINFGRNKFTSRDYSVSNGGDVIGPTIFGHNASRSGVTVAAIPYDNANTLETFSSRGPATYCWGGVVGSTPAAPITPCQSATVDLSAMDGNINSFFAGTAPFRFYGTSSAAPHAAAVAALIIEDAPCATPAQVLAAMQSNAVSLPGFTADAQGSGRVDANAALTNIACDSVSIGDVTQAEGTGSGTTPFDFVVSPSIAEPTAATNLLVNGSCDYTATLVHGTTNAGDFASTAPIDGTYTSPSSNVTFNVNKDSTFEPNETFTVQMSGRGTTKPCEFDDATALGTITNDDPLTPPPLRTLTVTAVPPSAPEGNSGTHTANFNVTLSGASASTVTVVAQTANGTAIAPADYATGNVTLTFNPGQTQLSVQVTVNGDTSVEPDETFTLNLSSPTNAAIATGSATHTILNDDAAPVVPSLTVTAVPVSAPEGNVGTHGVTFNVDLSATTTSSVTFDYATSNGTASTPSDYLGTTGSATIAAGQTRATVTLTVNGDTTVEPDETFSLGVSNVVGATVTTASATHTILNDDAAAPGSGLRLYPDTVTPPRSYALGAANAIQTAQRITFSCPGTMNGIWWYRVAADTGTQTVTAWKNGVQVGSGTGSPSAVGWVYVPFTSPVAVVAGDKFVLGVHHPNGAYAVENNQTPGVPGDGFDGVNTDALCMRSPATTAAEPNGLYKYTATPALPTQSYAASEYFISPDLTATTGPVPSVLTIANASTTEGNTGNKPLNFTISLSNPNAQPVSVTVSGASGTATGGSDFVAFPPTVVNFPPNTTSQTFTVQIVGDTDVEPDETFTVTLSNPTTGLGVTIGSPGTATGTILNDDSAPGTTYTLYPSNPVPPRTISNGVAITTAQRVNIGCAGSITGVWWYRTAADTGTKTVVAWSTTGVQLASGSGAPAATGWVFLPFTTPLAVSAGQQIVLGVHHPNGAYGVTNTQDGAGKGFDNRTVSAPCLSSPSTQTAPNGLYNYAATPQFPSLSYAASEYFLGPNLVV